MIIWKLCVMWYARSIPPTLQINILGRMTYTSILSTIRIWKVGDDLPSFNFSPSTYHIYKFYPRTQLWHIYDFGPRLLLIIILTPDDFANYNFYIFTTLTNGFDIVKKKMHVKINSKHENRKQLSPMYIEMIWTIDIT